MELLTRPWLLGLNLGVTVILGIVLFLIPGEMFDASDSVVVGALAFIVASLVEMQLSVVGVSRDVGEVKALRIKERQDSETRNDVEASVHETRRMLGLLHDRKEGADDLFLRYHLHRLGELNKSLHDATSKQEVRIGATMFDVTDWLMKSSFRVGAGSIFRAVMPTSEADLEFFFGVHGRRYFDQSNKYVVNGGCREIRRLFVIRDEWEWDPRLKRLTAFHIDAEGYDCRMILLKEYSKIARDCGLDKTVDFGVYGESYVYKAIKNVGEDVEGVYSRDPEEVERFTKCFDRCWGQGRKPGTESSIGVRQDTGWAWVFDGS